MNSQTYQLVVRKGPNPGQIFPLEMDMITIGRDPLSDIVLEDAEVSRHHARLTQSAGGYLLQDRGSTNGSFVDGERLGGDPVQLKPGQAIMFGTTVTVVFQAIPVEDPMATVVAPAVGSVTQEPEEPEAPEVVEVEEPAPEPAIAMPPESTSDEEEMELVAEVEEIEEEPEESVEEVAEEEPLEPVVEPVEEVVAEEEVDLVASQPSLEEEEEEEEEEEMATMIEAAPLQIPEEPVAPEEPEPVLEVFEPEPPALPVFDEPEEEPAALPAFDEPELPAMPAEEEAPPEVKLPSEPPPLEPLPHYEEPVPEHKPEPILDTPVFGLGLGDVEPVMDSGAPMPDFESKPPEKPVIQTTGEVVTEKGSDNRNRNIIIGVVGLLVLCCLCVAVGLVIYFVVIQPV